MKDRHDRLHRDLQFEVGEWAWLRLHQRAARAAVHTSCLHVSTAHSKSWSASATWLTICSFPPKARIHDVFHVVFLKKYSGDAPEHIVPLPVIVHGRAVSSPQTVLRARPSRTSWDLLVQWSGQPAVNATWEPLEQFKESFPDFQLEDKLFSYGEGSVVDRVFGAKYQRRNKKDTASSSG